jgi:hypothetical protein
MPVFDIVVLSLIVAVFTTFGVVLGWLTWYCSDSRKRPIRHAGHRHYGFPSGGGLITDDD